MCLQDYEDYLPCHELEGAETSSSPDGNANEWQVGSLRIHGVNLSAKRISLCNVRPCADQGRNWRLVWCHEHCHKEAYAEQREEISNAAKELNGSLICLKKADKFENWLDYAERPPYILLTNWRATQPCIQTVLQVQQHSKPRLTIVHCDGQRQFGRVTNWARTVSPDAGPILVSYCENTQDDSAAELACTILNGLRSQLLPIKHKGGERHEDPRPVASSDCNVQQESQPIVEPALSMPMIPELVPYTPKQDVLFEEDVPANSDVVSTEPPLNNDGPMSAYMTAPAPLNQHVNFNEIPFDTCSSGVSDFHTLRVSRFLSQIRASYDPKQLEQVLRCAMPNQYEE